MTECFSPEVRDFLPDLVHGRLGEIDTATMLAHVEACDACVSEVKLLRAVRQDAALAPAIDINRIVAALPAPKSANVIDGPARAAHPPRAWKFLATSAVILIAAVAGTRLVDAPGEVGLPQLAQPPQTAEATSALGTGTQASPSLPMVASVDDLTDDELEELLGDLENIETIPSAEPEVTSVGLSQDPGSAQ